MHKLYLHIIFMMYAFINVYSQQSYIAPLNIQKEYTAGQNIELTFQLNSSKENPIYIENSYGNTLVKPIKTKNIVHYNLPPFITEKKGWNYWQINTNNKTIKGSFYIHPLQETQKIETYLGPPSLLAGKTEHARLVILPLDKFDNPSKKNTPITIQESFVESIQSKEVYSEGIIGYDLIQSENKSGRKFLSVVVNNTPTKELSLEIRPNYPTNFTIHSTRVHPYADGNQTVTFKTSIIKDKYNNIVTDGTLINFMIINNLNQTFYTQGTTINGVATANIIHPDNTQTWTITAFVNEICESNTLKLQFKNAIKDFDVFFDTSQKILKIGPIQSYMSQFMPDGLKVKLDIIDSLKMVKTLTSQTENGCAYFYLNKEDSILKKCTLKVSVANKTKNIIINGTQKLQ